MSAISDCDCVTKSEMFVAACILMVFIAVVAVFVITNVCNTIDDYFKPKGKDEDEH